MVTAPKLMTLSGCTQTQLPSWKETGWAWAVLGAEAPLPSRSPGSSYPCVISTSPAADLTPLTPPRAPGPPQPCADLACTSTAPPPPSTLPSFIRRKGQPSIELPVTLTLKGAPATVCQKNDLEEDFGVVQGSPLTGIPLMAEGGRPSKDAGG